MTLCKEVRAIRQTSCTHKTWIWLIVRTITIISTWIWIKLFSQLQVWAIQTRLIQEAEITIIINNNSLCRFNLLLSEIIILINRNRWRNILILSLTAGCKILFKVTYKKMITSNNNNYKSKPLQKKKSISTTTIIMVFLRTRSKTL